MVIRAINYLSTSFLPMILLFVLLLISLIIMVNATDNIGLFGSYYLWFLLFNIGGVTFIALLILANILKLSRSFKKRVIGHKLLSKMIVIFSLLIITPVAIVFYFSVNFLNNSIENWVDTKVEAGLESALSISRQMLQALQQEKLDNTKNMVKILESMDSATAMSDMENIRKSTDAYEITYLDYQYRIIGVAFAQTIKIVPSMPDIQILSSLKSNKFYVGITIINDEFYIQTVLPVNTTTKTNTNILQALYNIDGNISQQTAKVQEGFNQYKQLLLLKNPLRASYVINLSLSLLLSILSSIWAVFYFSYRLLAPINQLVIATEKISDGDYKIKLKKLGDDELGFLVQSFNLMIQRIQKSNLQLIESQQQTQLQKNYLSTIITSLSNAVLVFEESFVSDSEKSYHLRMYNLSSENILQIKLKNLLFNDVHKITNSYPFLKEILDSIYSFSKNNQNVMQKEVTVFDDKKELLAKYNKVTLNDGTKNIIIILDDITELVQNRKITVWQEMAKRLAHEIKNPLTPIQLSTERLRHKYLSADNNDIKQNMELLDRATNTIIKQVQSMIKMVNAFNEFASTPKLDIQNIDLNLIITEVVALYQKNNIKIELGLDQNLPNITADDGRIRQLLHNMIKNAIEAQQKLKYLNIKTKIDKINNQDYVMLQLTNPGKISKNIANHIFEPYASDKKGGSGIGLSVVKKIITEIGGNIKAEYADNDVIFTIHIPIE
ncbi:MAG: hypothetical protein DRQ51_07885 [Gammaproteobacteria bacterium]|nr:MAG: hypothetical protein DRQ51_07885 [Gammaproteobacteria bacterium]